MNSSTYATPKILTGKDKDAAMVGFVLLAGLFIACPVSYTHLRAHET